MRSILIGFMLLLTCDWGDAASGDRNNVESVAIHYYGWNIRTRSTLTLEDVRTGSSVTTVINDDHMASAFVTSLKIEEFDAVPTPAEPRLVIDIEYRDGRIETYHASAWHLVGPDGRGRAIDDAFKARFACTAGVCGP